MIVVDNPRNEVLEDQSTLPGQLLIPGIGPAPKCPTSEHSASPQDPEPQARNPRVLGPPGSALHQSAARWLRDFHSWEDVAAFVKFAELATGLESISPIEVEYRCWLVRLQVPEDQCTGLVVMAWGGPSGKVDCIEIYTRQISWDLGPTSSPAVRL